MGRAPEKELARRETEKDRYPGERALQKEVRELLATAAITRAGDRSRGCYPEPAAVMSTPVGCLHSAAVTVKLDEPTAAGTVVWLDGTGAVEEDGLGFGGVVIAEGSTGLCAAATQGTVAVLVEGPFEAGDAVGADDSSPPKVVVDGTRPVGTVQGTYDGSETVLVPVRLGAGGGAGAARVPLGVEREVVDTVQKLRVIAGGINSEYPVGMSFGDTPHYLLTPAGTAGVVYAVITVDVGAAAGGGADNGDEGDIGDTGSDGDVGQAGEEGVAGSNGGSPGGSGSPSMPSPLTSGSQTGYLSTGSLHTGGLTAGGLTKQNAPKNPLKTGGLRTGSLETKRGVSAPAR